METTVRREASIGTKAKLSDFMMLRRISRRSILARKIYYLFIVIVHYVKLEKFLNVGKISVENSENYSFNVLSLIRMF